MKPFLYQTRVYFSDTDAEGIVYHARYLDFAEHARTELLRSLGGECGTLKEQGFILVVRSIAIAYDRPGKLDDLLTVETTCEEMKHFSLVLLQTVKRGEETLATLHVKLACVDRDTMALRPLPDVLARKVSLLTPAEES